MISRVKLCGVATYKEPVEIEFKNINFLYGGNGTGKTTLSRVLSGELSNSNCIVERDSEKQDKVLVYNKDFVEKNFKQVGNISGIFTLGKDADEAQTFIEQKEREKSIVEEEIDKRIRSIESIDVECANQRKEFDASCWNVQTKYGARFSQALTGSRKSIAVFAQHCLDKAKECSGEVKSLEDIEKLYYAAYSKESKHYETYSLIDVEQLKQIETNEILQKRITGKADSDIGKFIEYLNSSDWVKSGLEFAKITGDRCPYCSQKIPTDIKTDIESFFDETYDRECNQLKMYVERYRTHTSRIIDYLESILKNGYEILSYDKLVEKLTVYKTIVDKNCETLKNKTVAPSTLISIDSCYDLIMNINEIIKSFNELIVENNDAVDNQEKAQGKCKKEIWNMIISELTSEISEYEKHIKGKSFAKKKLEDEKKDLRDKLKGIEDAIRQKKASISSVEHTVQAVNNILEGYGFIGFKLAENEEIRGTYKIVREDNTDAKNTLSEGEYNFITFLYFYHLLFGSTNPDDINMNKIIVIDDPISSLDSNVLFIVSSLVRNIINFCREGKMSVEQVIISTHNIYFHKEITYTGARDHLPKLKTAYFIIRKKNETSYVTRYEDSQIQSSYEMLWDEIRNPSQGTAKSIFNTMRRILENYFNIIGGINYEQCVNEFDGEEKIICKSLISCINEQSHTIADDYFMCVEDSEIDQYISIFKRIFEKMNHISHYNMMMKIDVL